MMDEFEYKGLTEEEIAAMNVDGESEEDDEPEHIMTEEELEQSEEYQKLDEKQKGALRGLRERFKGRMEQGQAKAASNFLERWSELSGCPGDYDHIDYDNPYIMLEYAMCDPKTLLKLSSPRHREKTLAKFPEEVQKIFYEKGPGNSKRYCDTILTPGMVRKSAKSQLRAQNKLAKRHSSLTAEEKEKYKQMKAEQKAINKMRMKEARLAKKKNKRK